MFKIEHCCGSKNRSYNPGISPDLASGVHHEHIPAYGSNECQKYVSGVYPRFALNGDTLTVELCTDLDCQIGRSGKWTGKMFGLGSCLYPQVVCLTYQRVHMTREGN